MLVKIYWGIILKSRKDSSIFMKKIVVIDGQGGRMGKTVVEQLKNTYPDLPLTAIGTNSIATSAMLKAGADLGATGENPVITAAMSSAIGSSRAHKILIPVSQHCHHTVVGCGDMPLSVYIRLVCEEVQKWI